MFAQNQNFNTGGTMYFLYIYKKKCMFPVLFNTSIQGEKERERWRGGTREG